MKALEKISDDEAQKIGERLGVDFQLFTIEEFKDALNVELKAEIKQGELQPSEDLNDSDLEAIGRVTMSHINVFDD
ncbi:MAG: hypothetical protein MJA30_34125 [Cytophagales bacterium]|nr:hypothetical protein [Cytophagales bacterium]